jgi:TolB-like protein
LPLQSENTCEALIEIDSGLRVKTINGVDISPKAKKARALLVLLAMAEGASVSRQQAAATLWSSKERTSGLARLRDLLHDVRRDFAEAGVSIIDVREDAISLVRKAVKIQTLSRTAGESDRSNDGSGFLMEFEGIDPALDRRVSYLRAELLRPQVTSESPRSGFKTTRLESDRTSVAVAEFESSSCPQETELARALSEEVGSALARLRWFDSVTHGADGKRLQIGTQDLSKLADYALVGTLRSDQQRYRLLLKLLDFSNGGTVAWSASFEQERHRSILSIQEDVANAVACCIDTELMLKEVERQGRRPSSDRDSAYSLVVRAVPGIYRLERSSFLNAGHLLEQAIHLDRESALAHSWLAYWNVFLVGQGWADNPHQAMAEAGRSAERAVLLDPKNARAVTIAGHVKAFLHRRLDEAAALHELALHLNPALALAWHFSGMTHAYRGELDDAYRCISYSRHLAPADPLGFYAEGGLSIVQLLRHEHEAAAEIGRRVTERHPNFTSALKSYLATLGHQGRTAEADLVRERLLLLEPRFSLRSFPRTAPYQRPEDLGHFMTGLRLAGVT